MKGVHNDKLRQIIKRAEQHGWVITRTKNNHLRFFPPQKNCSVVFFSGTPSDWRAVKNLTSKLKREGLNVKSI